MPQVTHRIQINESGESYFKQVVSPEVLTRILQENGDTLDKPVYFGPLDEWRTDEKD